LRRRQKSNSISGLGCFAVRTDEQIAIELNRRHGTAANNKKNVAACRWYAEQKLRQRLAAILEIK